MSINDEIRITPTPMRTDLDALEVLRGDPEMHERIRRHAAQILQERLQMQPPISLNFGERVAATASGKSSWPGIEHDLQMAINGTLEDCFAGDLPQIDQYGFDTLLLDLGAPPELFTRNNRFLLE
ncbi:hypothetical protein GF362_01965 [Candidatus Dojkabacteria bacterium]|nr:hypothetical protein [Candidatus Dojkabacteria bacterium]